MKKFSKEADVKDVVKAVLKATPGCWWFMPPANGYGRAGIPDFLGTVCGRSFAVETKFGSGKPTPMQWREMAGLEQAGAKVWLVNEKTLAQWQDEFAEWVKQCS